MYDCHGSVTLQLDTCMFSCHIVEWIAPKHCRTVADIDDTEVIWIALLRHADKLVLPEDRTK